MAKQLAAHRVAVGRFGEPHEIAAAVLFLASEQAAWITGAALEVDGGTLRSV
jgi:NAD(P)-dependent dehydrogenase (short-subunit alcohol dehydrogenase family)